MERLCKHHGITEFRERKDRLGWRCKQCVSNAVSHRRKQLKVNLVNYFGGKCIKCGYDKCIAALEFHHRDPNKKDFGLSMSGLTRSWKRLLEEAKKCDLVCANCHAEIHHGV